MLSHTNAEAAAPQREPLLWSEAIDSFWEEFKANSCHWKIIVENKLCASPSTVPCPGVATLGTYTVKILTFPVLMAKPASHWAYLHIHVHVYLHLVYKVYFLHVYP